MNSKPCRQIHQSGNILGAGVDYGQLLLWRGLKLDHLKISQRDIFQIHPKPHPVFQRLGGGFLICTLVEDDQRSDATVIQGLPKFCR